MIQDLKTEMETIKKKKPHVHIQTERILIDRNFCPAKFHSHSVPKKHIEAYINYKLFGLLAQAYY